MFPHIADNTSILYIGKTVDNMSRKVTLNAHQLSSKHIACMSIYECKQKPEQGLIEKSMSKVEAQEVERYEKLFSTAFAVIKQNQPYSDYPFFM